MSDEMDDDDFEGSLHDAAATVPGKEAAEGFYGRVRERIRRYLDSKPGAVEKTGEYLLLVPDVFMLLWRLLQDSRVTGKNKVLLGSAVVYFIFPFDILPEAFLGPIGYLDDLVFGVYVLNRVLVDTDASILREHWSGNGDLLSSIQKVLTAADSLISNEVLGRIKRMVK